MTLNQKYQQLSYGLSRNAMIFKHVGLKGAEGGWLVEPMNDPDHDFAIPMLRVFAVVGNQKQRQQRVNEIIANGWQPFEIEAAPEPVKKSSSRSSTRSRKSTKSTSK